MVGLRKVKGKKRLLLVLHSLGLGGAEHLVVQMLPQLLSRYDVGILTLDSRGEYWESAEKQGAQLFCIERDPYRKIRTVLAARSIIRRFKPEIIHAHQYTPWFYSALGRMLSCSNAKLCMTEHGRHYPDIVSLRRKLINQVLLTQTFQITAVSEATKRSLVEHDNLPAARIQVIRNGLLVEPLATIDLRTELGIPQDKRLIGFVGSLKAVKNVPLLIRAFGVLKRKLGEHILLIIIGDGALRESLKRQVSELGLGDSVVFTGSRVPALPYLGSLGLFVLPSLSEGISLALLESMYSKVPVVASNAGGNPEVVDDGVDGFLFESGDVESLVASLEKGLACSSSIGESARAKIERNFSFESMVASYLGMYEEN